MITNVLPRIFMIHSVHNMHVCVLLVSRSLAWSRSIDELCQRPSSTICRYLSSLIPATSSLTAIYARSLSVLRRSLCKKISLERHRSSYLRLISRASILLLRRQVSVTRGCRWWTWSTHAAVWASQEQTLSGRGARVYTCACVHNNNTNICNARHTA